MLSSAKQRRGLKMISFGIVHKHLTIEEVKFMTTTHNVEINLYNNRYKQLPLDYKI